jgi:hypothetical protein
MKLPNGKVLLAMSAPRKQFLRRTQQIAGIENIYEASLLLLAWFFVLGLVLERCSCPGEGHETCLPSQLQQGQLLSTGQTSGLAWFVVSGESVRVGGTDPVLIGGREEKPGRYIRRGLAADPHYEIPETGNINHVSQTACRR